MEVIIKAVHYITVRRKKMNQERRLNILLHELLENHEPMTIKDLSLRLNVSYKTVQNDLV